MELEEALGVLGIDRDASWDTIKLAHRASILAAHPDAGGSSAAAAAVNQAFDLLGSTTDHGRRPLPSPPPPVPVPAAGPSPLVDHHDPREVLLGLADAAHDLGEVVFVDPDAGLLEVIVGVEPGVGQLTASVDVERPADGGVPVAFTLEPLGVTPAPAISSVVDELMRTFRRSHSR